MSISVPRTFFEVLVRACTDGTSVSELRDVSEGATPVTDVLYHLRTKFDSDTVASLSNLLFQQDVLEHLPQQV